LTDVSDIISVTSYWEVYVILKLEIKNIPETAVSQATAVQALDNSLRVEYVRCVCRSLHQKTVSSPNSPVTEA
jgi:hypothetical protein